LNKYGDNTTTKRIYFPYAPAGISRDDFRARKTIENCLPGLTANRPDIVKVIEAFQAFSHPENGWLPKFMELNNENKHQQLTPQVRKESKQLRISSGGVSISMGEGCRIELGRGASMSMGNAFIPGGQKIDVDNPAKILGQAKQEIITWVLFNFQVNNEPVLPLLARSLQGIRKIVSELKVL
jgi:hypothetical protein